MLKKVRIYSRTSFSQTLAHFVILFTDVYGDQDNDGDDYIIEAHGTNQFKTKFHVPQ